LSLGILAVGCAKAPLSSSSGGSSTAITDGPDLTGTWAAEVSSHHRGKSKDAGDAIGDALANAFVGAMNFKMRISEGNAFRLIIFGMPIDGHYTVSGQHLVFTPEKFMNKTQAQLKAMSSEPSDSKVSFGKQPMEAELSEDGSAITLHKDHDSSDDTDLVFRRSSDNDEAAKESVKSEEKNFVGRWTGSADMSAMANSSDKDERNKAEMGKGFAQAFELDLKEDNTFNLDMIINVQGTWSYANGTLTLRPNKAFGISSDSDSSTTMSLSLSPDQKSFKLIDGKNGTLTFTKAEG